jgi:hypothetical protein
MSKTPLFDWREARDDALEQVAANAEDECPGFAEAARAFVLAYLAEHGPASGEVVTNAAKAAGLVPHDDRAFGPVLLALSRAGRIRRVGTTLRTKGHGTAGGNVWEVVSE